MYSHNCHFNHIHLSPCRLVSWQGDLPSRNGCDKAEAVVSLVKHTVQAARAGDIGVQEIANTAYGAARSSKGTQMGVLFMVLARAAAERRMRNSISQQLASTPLMFSRLGHQEEQLLFTALAAAAERRMMDFNSLDLANTTWAFATVGHK